MSAYGLELYNEDLRDLAMAGGRDEAAKGWDGKGGNAGALKLQERPTGRDGRVVPEVRRRQCKDEGLAAHSGSESVRWPLPGWSRHGAGGTLQGLRLRRRYRPRAGRSCPSTGAPDREGLADQASIKPKGWTLGEGNGISRTIMT